MAHIIFLRYSTSFVSHKDVIVGGSQLVDRAINKRKYPLNYERKGYCKPLVGTWEKKDIRIKKELVPEVVRDLGGVILNPSPNKVTLWKIYRAKNKRDGKHRSVGRKILFIQWIFKWWVRTGTCPWEPVEIAKGKPNDFCPNHWKYHIILGILGS